MRSVEIPRGSFVGLNYSGLHDSSVAVVAPDGRPVFAMSLERVSRVKQDGRWPAALLDRIDFDRVAGIGLPYAASDWSPDLSLHRDELVWRRRQPALPRPYEPYDEIYEGHVSRLPQRPARFDHHLAHAAAAYFASGFNEATIVTYDAGAFNCPWLAAVYFGRDGTLRQVGGLAAQFGRGIAAVYTMVTAILGHTPSRHEGKITGLAAYDPVAVPRVDEFEQLCEAAFDEIDALLHWEDVFRVDRAATCTVNRSIARRLREHFGAFSDAQLASAVQRAAERHVGRFLDAVRRLWPEAPRAVAVAGGLFANVKINQGIRDHGFERVFVCPPMTDDGLALGAAFLAAAERGPIRPRRLEHVYLGSGFDEADAAAAVADCGLTSTPMTSHADALADLLAAGRTVCLFQGRVEYGPRALGNRTILYQTTDQSVNDWLNERLRRTEYMPFAPVTRIEDAPRCYEGVAGAEHTAEFMTITFNCTGDMRRRSPAVVHVDGTARPQLLARETNPLLYDVLSAYHARTGIPSLINTSFNMHESPIVRTPREAILGFAQARLDALYLCGILIRREGNEAALDRIAAESARGEVNAHLEKARREIEHAWSRAESYRREVVQSRRAQRAMETWNAEMRRTIDAQAAKIADLDRQLAEAAAAYQQREQWIVRQQAAIDETAQRIAELEARLGEATEAYRRREGWIQEQQSAIEWFKEQLAQHQLRIRQLEAAADGAARPAQVESYPAVDAPGAPERE